MFDLSLPRSLDRLPLLAVLLLGVACTDAATAPVDGPSRVAIAGGDGQVVRAGTAAPEPLEVRVTDADGDPVEGVRVRFAATAEGVAGSVGVVKTDAGGRARTSFTAPADSGTVTVRADLPAHPAVPSARFAITVVAVGDLTLTAIDGDGQRAETGSQLPVPLRVRVVPEAGTPRRGVAIAWTLLEGSTGARLTSDTTRTDAEGEAETLLSLGTEPGTHRVEARVLAPHPEKAVRFEAEAVAGLSSGATIAAVRPVPVRAGERLTIEGDGLAGVEAVRVEGRVAPIRAQSATELRVSVPTFDDRCWPARTTDLRVRTASGWSEAHPVELHPAAELLELAPGEVRTLTGPASAGCVQLAGHEGLVRLSYVVQSTARVPSVSTDARVVSRTGPAVSAGPRPALSAARRPSSAHRPPGPFGPDPGPALRRGGRAALAAAGARPARPVSEGAARVRRETTLGDTLTFNFPVESETLALSCEEVASVVDGVVRGVGDHVLVVEDVDAPGGGFTDADWRALTDELDHRTLPSDFRHFGEPADIDGNGRIIVLMTPEVNRLSPGGQGPPGGFFLNLDLADSGDPEGGGTTGEGGEVCPTSNEAEIVYLPVADPGGEFGTVIDRGRAFRNARTVIPHEVMHLVSAEQRIILGSGGFDDTEVAWLNEALSHMAEELAGHAVAGTPQGANLALDDFPGGAAVGTDFRAFHFSNWVNLRLFLRQPAAVLAVARQDPLGEPSSVMRGFGWLFLRWLADQHAAADPALLFRALSTGGPGHLTSVANVERATGERWEDLLADFALAVVADDLPRGALGSPHQVTTWNLRRTFEQLQADPDLQELVPPEGYPLAERSLDFDDRRVPLTLQASAAAYLRLQGRRTPATALELVAPDGGPLPLADGVQVHLARLR